MCVRVSVLEHVHMNAGVCGGQKRVSGLPGAGVIGIMNLQSLEAGPELGCSARARSALPLFHP